jgi:hypothetical protein
MNSIKNKLDKFYSNPAGGHNVTLLVRCMAIVTILAQLSSCNEYQESRFETYNDLAQSGYFQHGWIPIAIPTDSRDISETHDLDNNRVFGKFRYEREIGIDSLTESIDIESIITTIGSINRPRRPNWFPSDEVLRELHTTNVRYGDFYVLFDNATKVGYFTK